MRYVEVDFHFPCADRCGFPIKIEEKTGKGLHKSRGEVPCSSRLFISRCKDGFNESLGRNPHLLIGFNISRLMTSLPPPSYSEMVKVIGRAYPEMGNVRCQFARSGIKQALLLIYRREALD